MMTHPAAAAGSIWKHVTSSQGSETAGAEASAQCQVSGQGVLSMSHRLATAVILPPQLFPEGLSELWELRQQVSILRLALQQKNDTA